MTSTLPAIRCRGLAKSFGRVVAVVSVDLDVEEGKLLALLGPSGCGKTTVLRMVAGFETPDAGTIEIGGQDMVGPRSSVPPEGRQVGMVFQEYALFPHLTVESNVGFGLPAGKDRLGRIVDVLRLVGLDGVRHRMPHELSGGQQQRVALARALAPRPRVVLLDEPFSNLDAALRQRVRAEVRHILHQAGVTAVFVTHDQEEAFSLADEVAVMMEGRIVQVGTPERLYRRPDSHRVATFLGEANFLPGRAEGEWADCALGRVPLHHAAQGEVELMIRPEDVVMTADPGGPAEIVDREYYGHDQMLDLRLGDLRLKSRLVGCCRGFREGQRVRLQIDTPVMAYPSRFGCLVEAVAGS